MRQNLADVFFTIAFIEVLFINKHCQALFTTLMW